MGCGCSRKTAEASKPQCISEKAPPPKNAPEDNNSSAFPAPNDSHKGQAAEEQEIPEKVKKQEPAHEENEALEQLNKENIANHPIAPAPEKREAKIVHPKSNNENDKRNLQKVGTSEMGGISLNVGFSSQTTSEVKLKGKIVTGGSTYIPQVKPEVVDKSLEEEQDPVFLKERIEKPKVQESDDEFEI